MDDIPHVKLGRGVLIVGPEDLGRVTSFLGENKAKYVVRDVVLAQEDYQTLQQEQDSR